MEAVSSRLLLAEQVALRPRCAKRRQGRAEPRPRERHVESVQKHRAVKSSQLGVGFGELGKVLANKYHAEMIRPGGSEGETMSMTRLRRVSFIQI